MKINIPAVQLNDLGVNPPVSQREFKGVSTYDPLSLDRAYATDVSNVTTSFAYPAMATRPGFTSLGATGFFPSAIRGLAYFKSLVTANAAETHVVSNGNWYRYFSGAWASIASGLDLNLDWSFCSFKGNYSDLYLIGTNGTTMQKYSTAAGGLIAAVPTAPSGGNYVDSHDNRLYCAVGNELHFSALAKGDDWTTADDSGIIVIDTPSGEIINGIKAGSRHLMIFKPSSVHELWGTSPSNFRMDEVATDIGLLNNKCVTVVEGIVYWIDPNGIYRYGGSRPNGDFAMPVRGYILGMNKANAQKACVGKKGKNLYISIPYGAETEPLTTLEYSTEFDTWFVWRGITPYHYLTVDSTKMYIADFNSKSVLLADSASQLTDAGTTIAWYWISAPISANALAAKQQWYRLWIVTDIGAAKSWVTQLRVWLSPTSDSTTDWVLVKEIHSVDETQNILNRRIMIPLTTVANANFIRVKIEGTGPMKIFDMEYQTRSLPMY